MGWGCGTDGGGGGGNAARPGKLRFSEGKTGRRSALALNRWHAGRGNGGQGNGRQLTLATLNGFA